MLSKILNLGLFDNITKMKYDIPNSKPEMFDDYIKEIDESLLQFLIRRENAIMIIDYVGVKEINGPFIVMDGVKGVTFNEEMVDIRLDNGDNASGSCRSD